MIEELARYGIGLGYLWLGYFVLDLLVPGGSLGNKLSGRGVPGVVTRQGTWFGEGTPSQSAGLVTGAWMISMGVILAVVVRADHDLPLTAYYALVGLVTLALSFLLFDLFTPGKLGDEIGTPGPVQPLAVVTAAGILGIGGLIAVSLV